MATQEIKIVDGRQRLDAYDELNTKVDNIYSKECLCSETENNGKKVVVDFKKFVERRKADGKIK